MAKGTRRWARCANCQKATWYCAKHGCKPKKTLEQEISALLPYYVEESTGPSPLWAGAAKLVVIWLTQLTPAEALVKLREAARVQRKMTVSATYAGAAKDLAAAIRRAK